MYAARLRTLAQGPQTEELQELQWLYVALLRGGVCDTRNALREHIMATAKPKHFRMHDACRLHGDNGSSASDDKTKKILQEETSQDPVRGNGPCTWQWWYHV